MTVKVKLGRNAAHRKAMFRTMATQLFELERIQTTLPKAKQLRKFADRMITLAKRDTAAARVKLCGFVRTEREQHKVMTVLASRYAARQGGYTRVARCGRRTYDAAPMAYIELVDRPGELRPARPPPQLPHGAAQPHALVPPAARAALQRAARPLGSASGGNPLLRLAAQLQQQGQQRRPYHAAAAPAAAAAAAAAATPSLEACSGGSAGLCSKPLGDLLTQARGRAADCIRDQHQQPPLQPRPCSSVGRCGAAAAAAAAAAQTHPWRWPPGLLCCSAGVADSAEPVRRWSDWLPRSVATALQHGLGWQQR